MNISGEPDELDAALRALNSTQVPDDLADRIGLSLVHTRRRHSVFANWRPLLLAPLALSVVVLACVTVARQAQPWRPVAPPSIRTQTPARLLSLPDSAAVLPPLPGGRHSLPAQPRPLSTARAQPTIPFVYPPTRDAQLSASAAYARVTDSAVFDPRSSLEQPSPATPK